jgi:glycosyltransferase involved in cell wall biosynthesis
MEPVAASPAAVAGGGLARVAVVIPTWNEAEAIGPVVAEVLAQGVGQVIVADGSSKDGTAAIARAAGATVIDAGRGYGRACHLGAQVAGAAHDVIAFMDGDGADRPDQLALLCRPILEGASDFTIASRTRGVREPGSMNWHQVVAGALAGRLMGALYGVRYTDMCALRAIRRDALAALDMREMTYGWNIEMQMKAARSRLRIQEYPVPYRVRAAGHSKVAGSLKGTLRAGSKIIGTFARVATNRAA